MLQKSKEPAQRLGGVAGARTESDRALPDPGRAGKVQKGCRRGQRCAAWAERPVGLWGQQSPRTKVYRLAPAQPSCQDVRSEGSRVFRESPKGGWVHLSCAPLSRLLPCPVPTPSQAPVHREVHTCWPSVGLRLWALVQELPVSRAVCPRLGPTVVLSRCLTLEGEQQSWGRGAETTLSNPTCAF